MSKQNSNVQDGEAIAEQTRTVVRDEEGNYLFRKVWLAKYGMIDGPGKHLGITVVSEPNYFNPEEYGQEGRPHYIVNLHALLKSDLPKIKELIGDADFVRAEELKGLTLTHNIWIDDDGIVQGELPMKGDMVDIIVNEVPNREGDMVLRVTGMKVSKGVTAPKVDINALFTKIKEEVEA